MAVPSPPYPTPDPDRAPDLGPGDQRPVAPVPASARSRDRDRALDSDRVRDQVKRRIDELGRLSVEHQGLSVVGHTRGHTETLLVEQGDPHELLLGWTLPRQFEAVSAYAAAVVASGTGRHRDAMLAVAVDRSGGTASWLTTDHADPIETVGPSGWLIDACRRTLALATPPQAPHPLELPLSLWLDRVMTLLVRADGPVEWPDVVALCPVPERWQSLDPWHLGATMGSVTSSWAALRRAAGAGAPLPLRMRPEWAAWMDDPMFARWCVAAFPDLDELRTDVEFLMPTAIVERIDEALASAWSAWSE